MSGIGHNGGPALAPAPGWQRHCWRRARADLLPVLPVEVIRNRVRRAAELGIDYRAYASIRAASGHDVVAFLFSSNALRIHRLQDGLDPNRADRLAAQIGTGRLLAAHPPLPPAALADRLDRDHRIAFLASDRAPGLTDGWGATRAALGGLLAAAGVPARSVVIVGATALERDWRAAARVAGYIDEARFFSA